MKRIIVFALALCMALCTFGCNKSEGDLSSTGTEIIYEEIVVGGESTDNSSTDATTGGNTSVTDKSNVSSGDNTSTPDNDKTEKTIDYNTTVEIDICDDIIRGYLDASNVYSQYTFLSDYSSYSLDYQSVDLDWDTDGSLVYTLTVSENQDFSNAYVTKVKYNDVKSTVFVPGKTYYWKVTGENGDTVLGGGKLKIKNSPVRYINIDGSANARDMGGWKTESGKTVKYEKMYRGKNLDGVTETGLATIKQLGLKTEIDIRYANQKNQAAGTGMNYVFLETSAQYDYIFKDSYKSEVVTNYKEIFSLLSNESNYPFYTHCSAGADRTGTFAFITNGLLGVSYEDLTRDFELTSFSSVGKRWRGKGDGGTFAENDTVMQEDGGNYVAWGELYNKMMEYGQQNGCTTLSSSIEHWLTHYVGVPQSQIDSFKNIMLG